ncbi:MAG: hypothetical protein ACKPKO_44725, partial [Candidatus Fonsibacter sp.]
MDVNSNLTLFKGSDNTNYFATALGKVECYTDLYTAGRTTNKGCVQVGDIVNNDWSSKCTISPSGDIGRHGLIYAVGNISSTSGNIQVVNGTITGKSGSFSEFSSNRRDSQTS